MQCLYNLYKWNYIQNSLDLYQTFESKGSFEWKTFEFNYMFFLININYYDDKGKESTVIYYKWNDINFTGELP